jgi:hypothetical protein
MEALMDLGQILMSLIRASNPTSAITSNPYSPCGNAHALVAPLVDTVGDSVDTLEHYIDAPPSGDDTVR